MKNPEIPFSVKLTMAMLAQNREATSKIVAECIGEMTQKFLNVAHEYDYTDLPFVVATLRLTAQSLSLMIDDSGRALADTILSHTECAAVDLKELIKQMKEDDPDEKVE